MVIFISTFGGLYRMSVKVIGDSSMDLSPSAQKRLGIPCIPFSIQFGQESKYDMSFENEEMFEYNKTHKEICRSSAVNVGECMAFFEENQKDGSDLLYFSISSKLSSGYQNASIAAQGNPSIHIYDSQSMSLGIAMQALKAKELADEGKSIEEILPIVDEYRKNTCASLIVQDLSFFARGGRISRAAALGAGLLKIHPILMMNNGTLGVFKKLIGSSTTKLAKKYVHAILDGYNDIDYSMALVGYTSARDQGVDDIIEELKAAGFERVEETKTNSTNAVHGGPLVYGIAFVTSNEPLKMRKRYLLENKLHAHSSISHVKAEIKEREKQDK